MDVGDGIEYAEAELLGVRVCVARLGRTTGFAAELDATAARENATEALFDELAEIGLMARSPQVREG